MIIENKQNIYKIYYKTISYKKTVLSNRCKSITRFKHGNCPQHKDSIKTIPSILF